MNDIKWLLQALYKESQDLSDSMRGNNVYLKQTQKMLRELIMIVHKMVEENDRQ